MTCKYEKDYLKDRVLNYLALSNDPYQGSILWQGYLFGLVAGDLLDIEDCNEILSILPDTVLVPEVLNSEDWMRK